MPAESALLTNPLSQPSPHTWHGWWLARPKWLRIGCWAVFGLALIHVALTVWVATGLIEPLEIQRWRQRGSQLQYHDPQTSTWTTLLWPSHVYGTILEGLQGRSLRTVDYILLTNPTDELCQECRNDFPNLKRLILQRNLSDPPFAKLPKCCENEAYYVRNMGQYEWLEIVFEK